MGDDLCRFAEHYSGRHRPEDALWWLAHPDQPGPSGAAPVQQHFLETVEELERTGHQDIADALLRALADLLQLDRGAALDALHALEGFPSR